MDLSKLEPDQIKALIGLLSALLPSDQEITEEAPKKTIKKRKPKKEEVVQTGVVKEARSKAKGGGVNRFDKMPEKNAHKEDIAIDKKLCKYPPTERSRPFEFVKVQCRCCGKTEKVNPGLVWDRERYKCNKCAISAG